MKRFFTLITLLFFLSSLCVQAGNFRLWVDDPSKVDLMKAYSFSYISGLTPGEWNDVEFGDNDVELVVRSVGGVGCYSVKKDGASILQDGSLYKVPLSEGCSIEIITEFPTENYPVQFVFNGCMEDCISSLQVNYKDVAGFLDPGFSVAAGSRLSFTGNSNDYKFDSLKVNGEIADYDLSFGYTTLVTGPLEFEISAHRYRDFSVTINVNNPDGVTLMRDRTSTPIRLKEGDNTVIFNEKNPRLSIVPNDGYKLIRLQSADKDYLPAYSEYNQDVRVEEGMRLEIGVAELEIINNVIYFDDTASLESRDLVNSSWEEYEFASGYNVYSMFEGHNSFLFMPSATPAGVYLNGVRQESKYGDSWLAYEFTPEQNDVIKVFMLANPETYEVTFRIPEDDVPFKVFHDMIVPVENLSTPLAVLGHTLLTIIPEVDADGYTITVDDETIMPDDDGVYKVEIKENVIVEFRSVAAMDPRDLKADDSLKNVYNLQGVQILHGADRAQIGQLPSGIYIVDGRKVFVRH